MKHIAQLRSRGVGRLVRRLPDVVADAITLVTAKTRLPYPFSAEVAAVHGRKDFLKRRMNCLNGIFAPTTRMIEMLTRHGVDPGLIVACGYGIGRDDAVAPPLPAPGDRLEVGFIGTLAPHKGCHVVIDAFRSIDSGQAHLSIYGKPLDFPAYYADLQRRAAGLPSVTFCGSFPHQQIDDVLSRLHVLVVPSLWYENAPLVIHSALAAKRPVIVSDFPGLSELVKHGWNGLAFPPGDSNALRACLERCLAEPGLIAALSRNCRRPKTAATYVDELLAGYDRTPKARSLDGLENVELVPKAWMPSSQALRSQTG